MHLLRQRFELQRQVAQRHQQRILGYDTSRRVTEGGVRNNAIQILRSILMRRAAYTEN